MKAKPKIKLQRRYGLQQEMWVCVGPNMFGLESVGYGKTPTQAFDDWQRFYDFPF